MINNYKDLTVEKYLQLQEVDWTSMEEIDIQSTMISILADMDVDDVLDLPINEYRKMAAQLQFMTVEPKVKPRKIDKVKINGKEFYVLKDVKDMTAGQYIDYQSYIQQNDIKMLPYTLSCVIIPKGKKYGEVDAIEDIMQLSVEEALTIANFFMNKSRSLTRGTLLYLEWMMKKKLRKMKDETMKQKMEEAVKSIHSLRSLTKDGDGFLALMQLLKR
jgi:hypothetical protein